MATPQPITNLEPQTRAKFFYLFLAQVLLVVLFPYLSKPGLPLFLFRFLAAAAFIAAIYAVSEKRAQWMTALALAVPAAVLNSLYTFRPSLTFAVLSLIFTIVFLVFTLVTLLRAVLRAETVTLDTIYGAISVYLLMAMVWGTAYMFLETLQPGTLAINSARHPNHAIDWFDCMYYSFVTLTSTGYGDMVPATAQGRSVSILEAVSGIMYVAILIARLVSLYSVTKRRQEP